MDLRTGLAGLLGGIAIQIALPIAAGAVPLVPTSVDDAASPLSITLQNDGLASADDVVSAVIWGGTARDLLVLWNAAAHKTRPVGSYLPSPGEPTPDLRSGFTDEADGLNSGERSMLEERDREAGPWPERVQPEQPSGGWLRITSRN